MSGQDDYFGDTARHRPGHASRGSQSRTAASGAIGGVTSPGTPRTPLLNRALSSAFGTPGSPSGLRSEDDVFVLELGSRYLRMGLGGESKPRCTLDFGPAQQGIAGDFSRWMPDYEAPRPRITKLADWGRDAELWRPDLRGVDLGLVSDRLERAVRTAMIEHVLVLDESRKRTLVLVLPPALPYPLLATTLTTLFKYYPAPQTISVLPPSLLCVVGAGLRSGLVIDIGWAETSATAVYELREVGEKRTAKGMKALTWNLAQLLNRHANPQSSAKSSEENPCTITLEEAEEALFRAVWCRPDEWRDSVPEDVDTTIQVPFQGSQPPRTLPISFTEFSQPVEEVLFNTNEEKPDDDEFSLPNLIYSLLLGLSVDVRQACIPRLIFTGGGASIPGLKARITAELARIIRQRAFNPVNNYGSSKKKQHENIVPNVDRRVSSFEQLKNKDIDPASTTPAHLQPQLPDQVLARIQSKPASVSILRSTDKASTEDESTAEEGAQPAPTRARHVLSMGSWAGASLVAGLRLHSLVEIDREAFLQHGLAGADTDEHASKRKSMAFTQQAQNRRSLVAGSDALSKPGDRSSGGWTLGVWA